MRCTIVRQLTVNLRLLQPVVYIKITSQKPVQCKINGEW